MTRQALASRIVLLALTLAAALAATSCDSTTGLGVSASTPTRWGSRSSGPPVFVGGPSFQ